MGGRALHDSSLRAPGRAHPPRPQSLFVNPGFTSRIVGLTRPESDALLGFLYEHSVGTTSRSGTWTAGDIGFWDNRTTQHAVVGDFDDLRRVIQRITLRGDGPSERPRPARPSGRIR